MVSANIIKEIGAEADATASFFSNISLGQLLHIAGRQMDDILTKAVSSSGLTPEQVSVLGAVQRMPGHGQNVYARVLGINDATFGRYATRLSQEKLLRRRRSRSDRRLVALYPTDKGTELILALRCRLQLVNEQLDTLLPEGEVARMKAILKDFTVAYLTDPPDV